MKHSNVISMMILIMCIFSKIILIGQQESVCFKKPLIASQDLIFPSGTPFIASETTVFTNLEYCIIKPQGVNTQNNTSINESSKEFTPLLPDHLHVYNQQRANSNRSMELSCCLLTACCCCCLGIPPH